MQTNEKDVAEYRQHIQSMLFGLNDILKDTDDKVAKKTINDHLKCLSKEENYQEVQKYETHVRESIEEVNTSFTQRKKQMLTDTEIVSKINRELDNFRSMHVEKLQNLLDVLTQEIDTEIEIYRKEIIRRLDPYTIKERFPQKEDFELWLNTLNNNYRNTLNNSIERKTQSAIRSYITDTEIFFETASRYISDRENYMEIEDKFYGSLAISKNSIVSRTKNNVMKMSSYNKQLCQASEQLFLEMLNARKRYDTAKNVSAGVGTGVGAVVGGTAGVAAKAAITGGIATNTVATGGAVAKAAATVKTVATGIAVAPLPVIGVIIGAAAGATMLYFIAKKFSGEQMDKEINKCVDKFNLEIDNSRERIVLQITEGITQIFDQEIKSLERNFLEFRKTTYVEENSIPKDEQKIIELQRMVTA